MFKKKKKQKSEPVLAQPRSAEKKIVKVIFPKNSKVLVGGSRVAKTEKPVKVDIPKPVVAPKVKVYVFIITLSGGVPYEIPADVSGAKLLVADAVLEDKARDIVLRGFRFEDKWISPNVIKQVRWEGK